MLKRIRPILILVLDIFIINISVIMAYYLRFGGNINYEYFKVYLYMSPFITLGKIIVFYYFGFYKNLWKYAGLDELIHLFLAISISNGLIIVIIYLAQFKVPRSIYVITSLIDMFLFGLSRFSTKIFKRINIYDFVYLPLKDKRKRVMIVGAGEAGSILIQQFRNKHSLDRKPVCLIDDNIEKQGKKISGVPVVGTRKDIAIHAETKDIDEIIIALPSVKHSEIKNIIEECKKTECSLKILPNIHEIQELKGDIKDILAKQIRDVDVNDLLGRDKVELDKDKVMAYIKNKTVLVTGGGGSIGSELCRQILKFSPQKLILFDISENNLYDIQIELLYNYPEIDKEFIVGSIQDKIRLNSVFKEFSPDIVFHAAAHKHVPLMEFSPGEAVKNNVFGTLNLAEISKKYNIEKFILISTDKAVNPTNVMGATKRICEMIVQAYNNNSDTEFVAVRFGNVLGSRGSVIPLFKKQIKMGGPVTVTHPDVIRYFMTIDEAVELVLESAALAKGGEIFVLDMGEPVKIDKLAQDLIRLSGFEPFKQIAVTYTGLRPGEKLFEELLLDDKNIRKTSNDKIYVEKPCAIDYKKLINSINTLKTRVNSSDEEIKAMIKEIVPTYKIN